MSIYTKDLIKNDPDTVIGDWTYGNIAISRAYSGCKLNIGKFGSFGANITFAFWGKHSLVDITTYPFNNLGAQGWPPVTCTLVEGENISVGSDVWIGHNALIMQGAVIEDGAVIGANSVVGGHVPAYSIAVGNPCKVVRKRFSEEHIQKLLELKWWNWNLQDIKKHLQIISSPNIDALYQIWLTEIKK